MAVKVERDPKDARPFTSSGIELGDQSSSGTCASGNSGNSASSGSSACRSGVIGISRSLDAKPIVPQEKISVGIK